MVLISVRLNCGVYESHNFYHKEIIMGMLLKDKKMPKYLIKRY